MVQKVINITGNTKNIEGHAALVTENTGTYIIHGIDKWQDEWLDKKVKVIGDLTGSKENSSKIICQPIVQLLQ